MQHDYREFQDAAGYDEKDQIWILGAFLPVSAQLFLLKMGLKKKKKKDGYSKGCPESGGCREAVCPQTLRRAPWGHCHMSRLHHAALTF